MTTNYTGMGVNDFLSEAQMKAFLNGRRSGQRLGQAFFNALDEESQAKLRGSLYDPFYYETPQRIFEAIDFLTR